MNITEVTLNSEEFDSILQILSLRAQDLQADRIEREKLERLFDQLSLIKRASTYVLRPIIEPIP